ncbi:hypothetical protein PCANC_24871 [Puccinia coronata f. sp. avenae]|uniref:Uncharacterized protein n=1 Tax=Puccinia coronata f. sp. avenae TaxID=200324 RepID=A0A2N5S1T6_9BASI|nr:hypothetical protein PCANC_24871 [Puccinia coronata f. sp. avenae]
MLCKPFVVVVAISLITGGSFAIDCYPERVVDTQDCHAAMSQIVYNQDQTLSPVSKTLGYISGNCSVIVVNLNGVPLTRERIETGFDQILEKCQPHAGGGNLPQNEDVFLNIGNRGEGTYQPYESDFPPLKETCGLNKNAPDTQKDDCKKAYTSIPLGVDGQFLDDKHEKNWMIQTTYQTCTMILYTSDRSDIVANNEDVRPVFDKLLSKCKGKSGVVKLPKGAQGPNGRLFLKTRSSLRCGVQDAHKQICF